MATKEKIYLLLMLLSFMLASAVIVFHKRSDLLPRIGQCNPNGYADGGYFMAYCHSETYGDFEHYAYWNEIEPVSIAPVKAAEVLFLGNSRTQYAFSTNAVRDWFHQQKIKHYVFGFGIGSLHGVPQRFIKKFNLSPKVLVINADPFFYNYWSGANQEMVNTELKTRWRFTLKKWMQRAQQNICSDGGTGWLGEQWCSGSNETLYREPETGHWKVDHYRPDKQIPVTYTTAFMPHLKNGIEIAKTFIADTGLAPECILITATPQTRTPALYAQELSKAVGAKWLFPVVKPLKTIDKSHLNENSAERWSAAFMVKASDAIKHCTEG